MRLGVITCTARKLDGRHPAERLYSKSNYFRIMSNYVKKNFDKYIILSAKHGILTPETEIDTYNTSMKNLSKIERINWGKKVFNEWNWGDYEIHFFIGKDYWKPIEQNFKNSQYKYEYHKLDAIGKTMKKYKQLTEV